MLRALIQLTEGLTRQTRRFNKSIWNYRFVSGLRAALLVNWERQSDQENWRKRMKELWWVIKAARRYGWYSLQPVYGLLEKNYMKSINVCPSAVCIFHFFNISLNAWLVNRPFDFRTPHWFSFTSLLGVLHTLDVSWSCFPKMPNKSVLT